MTIGERTDSPSNDRDECETDDDGPKNESLLRERYLRDGFIGPIDVLGPPEARKALRAFQRWASASFADGRVVGDARFKPHLYVAFCNDLVHHPRLVHLVQNLLQTRNVLLWSCDFNIKYPQTESWFPPHQDSTYAGLYPPDQVLTVWLALSEVVSDHEGCLSFWKESHRKGQLAHTEQTDDATNMLSRRQRLAPQDDIETTASIASSERVSIPLRGGQATVHNFYTIHQSAQNRSVLPRIGLAMRYMAASVKQRGPVRESVTLVSGELVHDGFDLEPILPQNPTQADIERGKQAHADAMQREAQNYFQGTDQTQYDKRTASIP